MESLISEREGLVFQDIQELIPSSVSYQSSRRASGPNHPATDSFASSTLSVTPSKSESNLAVRLGRRLKGSFKDTKSLGSGLHKFMSVSLLPGASSSDDLETDLETTGGTPFASPLKKSATCAVSLATVAASSSRPMSGRSPASVIGSSMQSKAAKTHVFKKLKTPSRCKECDSYLYFQGLECHECGLAIHRKCLVNLKIFCAHKKLPKKMTVFGVSLSSQTSSDTDCVPVIVAKCIAEIDGRGRKIKGLYRVSGVKSQVERLCQSFENGPDLVDLSDVHPNVIANVLKLYFRQLPEPLLTYRLYPEFIRVAKRFPASTRDDDESDGSATSSDGNLSSAVSTLSSVELQEIHQLVNVVSKLPKVHYFTLSFLMHHLKRVAEKSCDNNMPSSNLGIVFGPTLLRTSEGEASLSSLVDTVHQTRVVDLLITYAHQVFGSPLTVDESGIITGFADPDDDEVDEEDDDEDGNERKSKEYLDDMLLESPLSPPPVLNPRGFGFGRLRPIRTKRIKGEYLKKIRDYRSTGIESSSDESSLQQQELYSSSDVITIAGQRVITRRVTSPGLPPPPCSSHMNQENEGSSRTLIRFPVKSASMSTFPFSSIRQLSTMPAQSTMNPSHDSRDWTIESSPLQKSASRQSMHELRKQFFSIPSTGVNYHEIINRKDSDDGSIGIDSFSDKTSLHHHDPYSSSGVIDEQKVITARVTSLLLSPPSCRLYTEETDEPTSKTLPRFPIKSASMSTFPFNSNKQLLSMSPESTLSPSQEEKDWVIRSSLREAPLQKSSSRMSMNELRKQFFTIPSTGVNYHEMINRKDSDDGSESELLSTAILLSSTASHAKLKRSGSGSGHHHLNLPSSTGASSSSDPSPDVSPRRRFLETQMLCNTTGPFSPHPESNVRRAPKFN